MKKYIYFLIVLGLFPACKRKQIPKVSFKVEKVTRLSKDWHDRSPAFELTLSSKENIVQIYKQQKAATLSMECVLAKIDTSRKRTNSTHYVLSDYVINTDTFPPYKNGRYFLSFPIAFGENYGGYYLKEAEIKEMLKGKDCLECKIAFTFFPLIFQEPNFANNFCIPVDSFLLKLK